MDDDDLNDDGVVNVADARYLTKPEGKFDSHLLVLVCNVRFYELLELHSRHRMNQHEYESIHSDNLRASQSRSAQRPMLLL